MRIGPTDPAPSRAARDRQRGATLHNGAAMPPRSNDAPGQPRSGDSPPEATPEAERGPHTLRVWHGQVVGVHGGDVFVEFAPRVQGVAALASFDARPELGSVHGFTLRGQEEGLWALLRVEQGSLASWETMEVGSLVHARVVRTRPGGLEAKVGPLHAFLPKSQTGLARDERPDVLVGKTLACEVVEVDPDKQRCLLSRKLVLARERAGGRTAEAAGLRPGQVVQGQVTRVEPYGAFVAFGAGLEGLVHVSNIAWERVRDPRDVVAKGASVEAVVLTIRRGGKRIGLGFKQLRPSPWRDLDPALWNGRVVLGTIVAHKPFGAFVRVRPGVDGLLHESQSGLGPRDDLRRAFPIGRELAVRVLEVDPGRERLSLSAVSTLGRALALEDVDGFEQGTVEAALERTEQAASQGALARALRDALRGKPDSRAQRERDGTRTEDDA